MAAITHPTLHPWDLSPVEAVTLQKQLAQQAVTDQPLDLAGISSVAGVDVSVKAGRSRAAIVVMALPTLRVIETSLATMPTPFPYVPGLLSFREGPVILAAYRQLKSVPDVLIFDGQGLAHPRRIGIATHIGLWLQKPTIGCGKSRLIGRHAEPDLTKGAFAPLYADNGDILGVVLRTRTNVKPVYISPGHRCDVESARQLAMACVTRYRLPEPIRQAHHAASLRQ